MDLISVYRDVLTLQLHTGVELVNEELRGDVVALAHATTAEQSLRRIEAVFEAREQMLEFNVPPLLALESMMMALRTTPTLCHMTAPYPPAPQRPSRSTTTIVVAVALVVALVVSGAGLAGWVAWAFFKMTGRRRLRDSAHAERDTGTADVRPGPHAVLPAEASLALLPRHRVRPAHGPAGLRPPGGKDHPAGGVLRVRRRGPGPPGRAARGQPRGPRGSGRGLHRRRGGPVRRGPDPLLRHRRLRPARRRPVRPDQAASTPTRTPASPP